MGLTDFGGAGSLHPAILVRRRGDSRIARGFRWDFAGRRSPAAADAVHLPPRGSVIRFFDFNAPTVWCVFAVGASRIFCLCLFLFKRIVKPIPTK